jgi:hypothetical protein
MLARVTPGLGHATQTDFHAGFVFRDGAAHSRDIVLDGDLMRLLGEGDYGFDGSLEFNIKAKPTGEGVIAEVMTLITSPLTFLLEFHLDGTLAEPTWRPQNLPKELFFIMD